MGFQAYIKSGDCFERIIFNYVSVCNSREYGDIMYVVRFLSRGEEVDGHISEPVIERKERPMCNSNCRFESSLLLNLRQSNISKKKIHHIHQSEPNHVSSNVIISSVKNSVAKKQQ